MAVNIQVKIEGLDKLKLALIKSPELVIGQIEKAIGKSMVTLENEAKKEAPVNKGTGGGHKGYGGNLRQNIIPAKESRIRSRLESRAPYSVYVHEGTRPHLIRSRGPWSLRNAITGQAFGRIVHHPGTKANPFFERALRNSRDRINKYFLDALDNVAKMLK